MMAPTGRHEMVCTLDGESEEMATMLGDPSADSHDAGNAEGADSAGNAGSGTVGGTVGGAVGGAVGGSAPATGDSAEPAEALAALVARLRSELTGVRAAMRNRAVIEQAKGVLVERLGITPDQGFDHLVRLSQRTNIKLIEVAAAVVGTTAPDPNAPGVVNLIDDELREYVEHARTRAEPKPAPPGAPAAAKATAGRRRSTARRPEIEALQAQHQLLSARIAAARSYDEIAEAIGTAATGWPPPTVVLVTLLDPDGAQHTAGVFGLPGEVRSQWSRIPPDPALPKVIAVRDSETIWLDRRTKREGRFAHSSELPFGGATLLAAPLIVGDRTLGCLVLSWVDGLPENEEIRRYITALVDPVARRVDSLVGDDIAHAWVHMTGADAQHGAPAQVWLPTVIDTLHHPATLLSPVIADGQIVDFRMEYGNALARELMSASRVDANEATVLAVYPTLGSTTLLPEFARLLHDGQPRRLDGLRADPRTDAVPAAQSITLHAVRLWDRVFAVWRLYTEADLLHEQLLHAERIAGIGSFTWDLRDSTPRCSPQLVRMFHPTAARTPTGWSIEVQDLTNCVHDDDLLAVQDGARRTVVEGRALLAEFRGAGPLTGRRLRLTAEPLLGDAGNVTAVRGTLQDVTEERAIEARLRRAEEALAAQRHRVDDDRRAAAALQQALLPTEPELGHTEGITVRGRCRSAQRTGTVQGDWYDATPLPGGNSLVVLGDVDDRGLSSMTTAARLRYALRAYASLDMPPGQMLTALNGMLCDMETEHTACVAVARFAADRRTLTWAAAGQVAPVRYHADGSGSVLSGSLGLPLGEIADMRYSDTTVELDEGDRILLYTATVGAPNGRRRGGGLDRVRRAAETVDLDDLDAMVTHVTSALGTADDDDICAVLLHVS